jgi:hypothetical protein
MYKQVNIQGSPATGSPVKNIFNDYSIMVDTAILEDMHRGDGAGTLVFTQDNDKSTPAAAIFALQTPEIVKHLNEKAITLFGHDLALKEQNCAIHIGHSLQYAPAVCYIPGLCSMMVNAQLKGLQKKGKGTIPEALKTQCANVTCPGAKLKTFKNQFPAPTTQTIEWAMMLTLFESSCFPSLNHY